MKVAANQPFMIAYSVFQHEYLGYLLGAFAVQLNAKGEPTLRHQIVSTQNVAEFGHGLDETDFELVKAIEAIQQDTILKKFNPKKLSAFDFFQKVYDPQKGDKILQEAIDGYVENLKADIFEKILQKQLFIMGADGNPVWKAVQTITERAKVYFHFIRNTDNTHYFPIVKHNGQRLQLRQKHTALLCDEPVWLLIDDKLYHFDKYVEGKKLRPFLNKNHIVIPQNVEEQYYHRFVAPLIAIYDVYAQGFDIRYQTSDLIPVLTISEQITSVAAPTLFGTAETPTEEETDDDDSTQVLVELSFRYGEFTFRFDSFNANANVKVEKQGDNYIFHKIRRNHKSEKSKILSLKEHGLDLRQGRSLKPKNEVFEWLQTHALTLQKEGVLIQQNAENTKQYFLGYSSFDLTLEEGRDWFDVKAKVKFGPYEIPFIKLKNLILARKREFTLPNGQIAVIPEVWLTRYSELFALSEYDPQHQQVMLRKHHWALVRAYEEESLATVVMNRKLENLRDFSSIAPTDLPTHFKGTLRPYQKAAFDWINFLAAYRFGGCLADDMGLGKTVTTLAVLQHQKEQGNNIPSLLVMPTSLLYNWQIEAQRFTPSLRVLIYAGTYREKNPRLFDDYDLVLTSYGIVRMDIEMLKSYRFNYVILDESQAIKNPSSNITKAVMQLEATHRLILTGTPLENTTLDLWSQLSFINPGLLGSQSYFRTQFQSPIEKHNDPQRTQRLYALIKPFMLRRHKSQVAPDLPPKVESVQYCEMTESQEKLYEEAKSYYRNFLLERIEADGMAKSQMLVLQGLTKLRQLANHPRMIDQDYKGESGKLEEIQERLETLLSGGHKVLIFSQFVKHLSLFRQYLDEQKVRYSYLDGSTTDRQAQVQLFQEDPTIQIFLISLKAGGVGLNLTAADYVFILDPWWNPAIEAQAIDRAHRIGQQKTVFTYKFITKNSVEEKILDLQRSKKKLFENLITTEEGFVKSLTKDDILSLLA
ncbi:MAG: DEAD/DEAH box helicase [Runella sp.]